MGWTQFFAIQFAVLVLVELGQCLCRILHFIRRNFSVSVGIECFLQRMGRMGRSAMRRTPVFTLSSWRPISLFIGGALAILRFGFAPFGGITDRNSAEKHQACQYKSSCHQCLFHYCLSMYADVQGMFSFEGLGTRIVM